MDTIFRRKLRSKQGEVWQLGCYQDPVWTVPEEGGQPFRPRTLVCLSVRTGRLQSSPQTSGEPGPEAFREIVTRALRAWRLRPERIEVTDARIAEDLGGFLSAANIPVEVRYDLPELRALLEESARSSRKAAPPEALSGPGLTVERMAAFARAAARFTEAAPWRHLGLDDPLTLESAGLPEELRLARVIGPPHAPGAVLFRPEEEVFEDEFEWEEEDWEIDPWEEKVLDDEGLWKVSLVAPSELPPEDVELWMEHGLPLAGPKSFPLALRRSLDGAERPDARLLSWFEAILSALATTTEEEMDTGQWEKEVATFDGPVRLALSLPDLFDPPYADSLPRDEGDDRPEPERLADEIACEAGSSWGRRQIHLARRAVALWPDCIDGWLVLAHRALDRESARDLYAEAVAAGERLLPGIEKRADPFDKDERRAFSPYLWARTGLAKALWNLGEREEAVGHFQWLLAADPAHHGLRDQMVHALLALGRNEEVEDLLNRYVEDNADWCYTRALLTFRQEGDSPTARWQMAAAFQIDRHIAKQLLGIGQPEEDEEESYALLFQDVWADTPGALEALRSQSAALAAVARARKAKKKGKKKRKRRH
ncbi:MAG TPA: hypothetical protein VN493_10585 [Thermoanaerobaculia bacterium]|nr:hypothetical protein [Thermoanaerobaculia bacterium]